jgi:hypothetical protein
MKRIFHNPFLDGVDPFLDSISYEGFSDSLEIGDWPTVLRFIFETLNAWKSWLVSDSALDDTILNELIADADSLSR